VDIPADEADAGNLAYMNLLLTLVIGLAAFASTNTDNLFLLMILFAERRVAARSIVAGEYVACTVVLGICGTTVLITQAVPIHWLALLGVAPLTIGLSKALRLFLSSDDSTQLNPKTSRTSALSVALLALAISGDNIGVYGALFPTLANWQVVVLMLQFLLLLGIWCAAAKFLATRPALGDVLHSTAYAVMPLVLIGIGLLILSKLFH
jgi:cadmium resistance protein CadD (predicted permease)